MKINLNTRIKADTEGKQTVRLGDIFETALFKSTQVDNAREIYDKIHGKEEVELSVKELSNIQDAVNPVYVAGIRWQIDDIINK